MSTGFMSARSWRWPCRGRHDPVRAEAQAEKAIAVDGIVGSADLFANEVVAALGGDPAAGLRLSERMAARA